MREAACKLGHVRAATKELHNGDGLRRRRRESSWRRFWRVLSIAARMSVGGVENPSTTTVNDGISTHMFVHVHALLMQAGAVREGFVWDANVCI